MGVAFKAMCDALWSGVMLYDLYAVHVVKYSHSSLTQFQSRLTFQVAVSNVTRADTSGVAAVFAGPARQFCEKLIIGSLP